MVRSTMMLSSSIQDTLMRPRPTTLNAIADNFSVSATDKPLRFIEAEKPGFFKRLFGSK